MQVCHITDTTWNPRLLPGAFGDIAENYQSMPASRHLADGWRVAVPAVPPDGTRIVESRVTFTDAEARQVIWNTANIADEAAAAEAARIGDLAAQYGQLVGTLAQALAAFGLAMPITAVEALPQVYAQYKADATKGPEVDLLQSAYAAIQGAGLADDDIYAVARAIGAAE